MDNDVEDVEEEVFELRLTRPVLWLIHSVMEEVSGESVSMQELDEVLTTVLSQEGIEILDNVTQH